MGARSRRIAAAAAPADDGHTPRRRRARPHAADAVPASALEVLVAAAYPYEIGYAPGLTHAHFHPLDGARVLPASGTN
jgi:hypothetical protein